MRAGSNLPILCLRQATPHPLATRFNPMSSTAPSLPVPVQARSWTLRFQGAGRTIALIAAFAAVTYMTVFMAFLVPDEGVNARWSRGTLVIDLALPGHPAAPLLQAGDVLLAIDGRPARLRPFRPLYWPMKAQYRYDILRDGAVVSLDVPLPPAGLRLISERLVTSVVAYLSLALVAVLVLAARRQREATTLIALILFASVVLVATDAQVYNVPAAALLGDPLLPLAAVAFAHVAVLPNRGATGRGWRTVLVVLYVIAALMGLATLYEVLWLRPQGTTLLAGWIVPWLMVLEAFVAVALLTNVLILVSRLRRETNPYHRRQTAIVLVATGIALFPLVFLSLLPTVLIGQGFVPWAVSLVMLVLIPLAYGYVIVRHRYLGLDLHVTRLLALLLVAMTVITLYMVAYFSLLRLPALQAFEPLPTTAFLAATLLLVVPNVSRLFRHSVERVVFGPDVGTEEALTQFIARLAANRSPETMTAVVQETVALLGVERAVLLLREQDGSVLCLAQPVGEKAVWDAVLDRLPEEVLIAVAGHAVFARYPWAQAAARLEAAGETIGAMLVGRRNDGGYFDARQVQFIAQVAQTLAVAGSVYLLTQSLKALTRDIVTVREMERLQLSLRLHDDPLQTVALTQGSLQQMLAREQVPDPARRQIETSLAWLRDVADELRDICVGLYPPVVDQGITFIVSALTREFRQRSEAAISVRIDIQDEDISSEVRRALYHVLQESLNNVAKHAQATTVSVEVVQTAEVLRLRVADDGVGLSPERAWEQVERKRFGLTGMEQWAILVNGRLAISARPEGGTLVLFEAPLPAPGSNKKA